LPDSVQIAVFVSGGGSNLGAILAAQKSGQLSPARVALVISSQTGAKALERAREFGVPSQVIERRAFPSEALFEQALLKALQSAGIQLICLAGYLRRLSPELVAAYRGRILNIHPSLLPKYGGAGMYGHFVHDAVLKSGETVSGCSVHSVDEEFDHGAVIARAEVAVLPGDTTTTLAARVLEQEHQLYPKTIAAFASTLIGVHHD
jgi:phosphoribosylglycinamide formyltransferase-1